MDLQQFCAVRLGSGPEMQRQTAPQIPQRPKGRNPPQVRAVLQQQLLQRLQWGYGVIGSAMGSGLWAVLQQQLLQRLQWGHLWGYRVRGSIGSGLWGQGYGVDYGVGVMGSGVL